MSTAQAPAIFHLSAGQASVAIYRMAAERSSERISIISGGGEVRLSSGGTYTTPGQFFSYGTEDDWPDDLGPLISTVQAAGMEFGL